MDETSMALIIALGFFVIGFGVYWLVRRFDPRGVEKVFGRLVLALLLAFGGGCVALFLFHRAGPAVLGARFLTTLIFAPIPTSWCLGGVAVFLCEKKRFALPLLYGVLSVCYLWLVDRYFISLFHFDP